MDWQPIETAPLDKRLLLWWVPSDPNQWAEACVIGEISSHEEGQWYSGTTGTYQDIKHITHWSPLPDKPPPV